MIITEEIYSRIQIQFRFGIAQRQDIERGQHESHLWAICSKCGCKVEGIDALEKEHFFEKRKRDNNFICNSCGEKIYNNFLAASAQP